MFSQSIGQDQSLFAIYDDKLLGYAVVSKVLDELELQDIAVSHLHRKKGIATKLLKRLQNDATQTNASHILLEVSEQNQAARHTYHKCGFEQCGRRKNYYAHHDGSYDDAILMRLSLK